jgi:two-component sensor histidine kinase
MAAQIPTAVEEAALSLTLAVVSSSPSPLLLLDGALNIVAASASFYGAFALDPALAPGSPFFSLGDGEWDLPQLRSLLAATLSGTASIQAYEMDLKRPGQPTRRVVVHAQRLVYLDLHHVRLLVAASDVTDLRSGERIKDEALNEALQRNLVLLQEVRHRVANSLQIIASILLQNARRTQSDETLWHLKDAHHRVMSIAALERQLAGTGEGEVEIRAYFTELCGSIAASMISGEDHISLVVGGGEAVVEARVSVSLGLIVTELVINALKHAFPANRPGSITVAYENRGPNWTLRVTDDGVGMPTDPALIRTGLGTSIVQSLAKQLEASVVIATGHPGTRVSIEHIQVALVGAEDARAYVAAPAERPAA